MVTFSSFLNLLSSSCVLLFLFLAVGAKNDVTFLCQVALQPMDAQVAEAASHHFISLLLAGDLLPSCWQLDSLESWLASLKCCDVFFWIQSCRLRLIPCPLTLVLFVFLCWVSSICSCLLSHHSVATSCNKYSVQLGHCLLQLFDVAIWQQGENPFALWSQGFCFSVTSRLQALTLFLSLCGALQYSFSALFVGSYHLSLSLQCWVTT